PFTFSLAMSVPIWTPPKSPIVRVLQTTLPGTAPPKLMLPAVAVVPNVRWPPTPRDQTPPACWSGCGLGGEATNAVHCDRNAVLAACMDAARLPTWADTPATGVTAGPVGKPGGGTNPGAVH